MRGDFENRFQGGHPSERTSVSSHARWSVAGLIAVAVMLVPIGGGVLAAPAAAQETHVLLETIPGPTGSNLQVEGVDREGNLYVWVGSNSTVVRINAKGEPVNFPALGTNVIDGRGGGNCPTVLSDCDETPNGELIEGYGRDVSAVAVDDSGGPADGDIYVVNNYEHPGYEYGDCGRVEVFAHNGERIGEVPWQKAFPGEQGSCGQAGSPGQAGGVSVAGNGHVFVGDCCGGQLDQYAPLDADPAHDAFVGEVRGDGFEGVAAGEHFAYGQLYAGEWLKFRIPEFLLQHRHSESIDFSPFSGPWEGQPSEGVRIDPKTEHAYIFTGGQVQEWDADNNSVGPPFGTGQIGSVRALGIDRSGGPNDGHLYMVAANEGRIAVFSGPVIVPNISYGLATIGHTTAHVTGVVSPAAGPQVTNCVVEYGFNRGYGSTAPCSPAAPYSGDTEVSADLTGLSIEHNSHYRIVATNVNGTSFGTDQIVRAHAVLGLNTDPATGVDETHATLNGSLNPDGFDTTYHFAYGVTTQYDTVTPMVDMGAAPGEVSVAGAALSNLQPGRTYHYALVAENSLGITTGEDKTFTTPRLPAIGGLDATEVTETSATIRARINPFGADTTYHFEYGTTPSYGSSAPQPDGDVGSGFENQLVELHLTGLEPGKTYHFRVIAGNTWGTIASDDTTFDFFPPECPNAHARQVSGSNYLPDCRAYELVTPGDAGAVEIFPSSMTIDVGKGFGFQDNPLFHGRTQNTGFATSPSRFNYFGGLGVVRGVDSPNSFLDAYVATRTSQGWITTRPFLKGTDAFGSARWQCNQALSICLDHPTPGFNRESPDNAPYMWSISGKSLGRLPTNLGAIPGGSEFFGDQQASPDFSHYLFSSRNLAFAPGGGDSAPGSAYDNDLAQGTVTLISTLSNGEPIPQEPSTIGDPRQVIHIAGVSTDGSHVLMATTTDPSCNFQESPFYCPPVLEFPLDLYMRVDDSVTYDITGGNLSHFIGMSPDGSKVYFSSAAQLTSDDTDHNVDIFVWNESTNEIIRISKGAGNGNAEDCTPAWSSGCDAVPLVTERPEIDDTMATKSGDLYFYSPESLDPSTPGIFNQRNLYVYRNGSVKLVGTLNPGTEINRIQISPDGSHAAFLTAAQLTVYDNKGFREMYKYTPDQNLLQCVSCNPTDQPAISNAAASDGGRFMSDDGRVFFSTADALVPRDTDGIIDTYESADGRAQLISTGTGDRDEWAGAVFFPEHDTGLEGVSRDGVDAYFTTFDSLVPEDHNGSFIKVYDARTAGGFGNEGNTAPCKAADECHGVGSTAPTKLESGTTSALGNGNKTATQKSHHRKRHHKRHHQRRGKGRAGRQVNHG